MRIVVAPDKFKGTLTAVEVAAHITAGLLRGSPDLDIMQVPVADGGDGTVDAAIAAGFRSVPGTFAGPTGEPHESHYARRGVEAVLELADVCGLVRLPAGRFDPLGATTYGLGEMVRAAMGSGCRRIVIAVGGSASTDGGAGMLQALGARIVDHAGRPLGRGAPLTADALDLSGLHPAVAQTEFIVASDVTNPLYGPAGAARVYAPQKGAGPDQVEVLELALRRWAKVVGDATGTDYAQHTGSGAAGGVAFAAQAVLGAHVRSGIDLVLELVGFADHLAGADLVITGEGCLDRQTLAGKAPAGVAAAARQLGIPTIAIAGTNTLDPSQLNAAGISRAYAITDSEPDIARCIAEAGPLLEQLAATVALEIVARPRLR